jgi:hypothetical protein
MLRSSRDGSSSVLNLLTVSVHRMRATAAARIWSDNSLTAGRGGGKCWTIEPSLQLARLTLRIAQHKVVRTNLHQSDRAAGFGWRNHHGALAFMT